MPASCAYTRSRPFIRLCIRCSRKWTWSGARARSPLSLSLSCEMSSESRGKTSRCARQAAGARGVSFSHPKGAARLWKFRSETQNSSLPAELPRSESAAPWGKDESDYAAREPLRLFGKGKIFRRVEYGLDVFFGDVREWRAGIV